MFFFLMLWTYSFSFQGWADSSFRFSFDPAISGEARYYLQRFSGCPISGRSDDCITNYNLIIKPSIESQIRFRRLLKAKISVKGYFDFNNEPSRTYSLGKILTNDGWSKFWDEEIEYGDLAEAYVSARIPLNMETVGPLTVTVGRQLFNWGIADGYNPIDVVNARRYYDLIHSEKLGANAISMELDSEHFNLELLYLPFRRKSILPRTQGRWMPRDALEPQEIDDATINISRNTTFSYALDDVVFNNALKHNYGTRFRGQLPSIDFSLVYFDGVDSAPATAFTGLAGLLVVAIDPIIIDGSNANIELTRVYYRRQVIGGGFSWSFMQNIIRLEMAYKANSYDITDPSVHRGAIRVQSTPLPRRAWEGIIGIERNISIFSESITAILQTSYADRKVESDKTSLPKAFDRAIIGGARYSYNDDLSFTAFGLYEYQFSSSLFSLDTSYRINNSMIGSFVIEMFQGPGQTPLGTYKDNDRLIGNLTYRF